MIALAPKPVLHFHPHIPIASAQMRTAPPPTRIYVLHLFSYRLLESIVTNLTIALDEAIIRKARIRAIHEGTSVSAKVREFLADYAQDTQRQQTAGLAFLAAARRSKANSEGAHWSRDDAYDRPYPTSAKAATGPIHSPSE